MSRTEFGTLRRVLKFIDGTHNDILISDVLKEFNDELTDEQIDFLISEFKFHDSTDKDKKKGPQMVYETDTMDFF